MASFEDDKIKLSALAALRQQRPAFARMVSWEFGRVGAHPARKSKYKGRYKNKEAPPVDAEGATSDVSDQDFAFPLDDSAQITDNNVTDQCRADGTQEEFLYESDEGSDGSSIYFSAEEDTVFRDPDNEEPKGDNPSIGDQETSKKNRQLKPDNAPQVNQERRRRPSKKQRKRRIFRLQFSDYSTPFKNAESLGMDMPYSSVRESVTTVSKEVPSLVELCMRSNKLKKTLARKSSSNSPDATDMVDTGHAIPPGIHHLTAGQRHQQVFASIQLAWLHRVLSVFDYVLKNTSDNMMIRREVPPKHKTEYLHFKRKFRDIWHLQGEIDQTDVYNPETVQETSSLCLPDTVLLRDALTGPDLTTCNNSPNLFMSHVAHCIDLMLPSCSALRRGKPGDTDEALVEISVRTAIARVSIALQSRYPKVVECLFNEALPYALWARGQVKRAAELLLALSELPRRGAYRAMHLNEAGRMYAQFGDEEMARKMFMRAADVYCQKVSKVQLQTLINGQALMLVAAVEDIGVLSPGKARQAANAWQAVLNLYNTPKFVAEAVVASLLCFHAGQFTESSWHEEVKSRLQSLAQRAPHVYLYISMVYALCGEQEESESTYKTFLNKNVLYDYDSIPGRELWVQRRERRFEYTPWQTLINVTRSSGQICLIPVVWRMQLCHPVYTEESDTSGSAHHVTDLCTKDLHLHLTKDGYLTGNMQMVLPPMKSVYFDPFTGSLVFPNVPLHTEVWNGGQLCEKTLKDNILLPTSRKLYEDKDGNIVESLFTSKLQCASNLFELKNGTQTALLFWCGGDGHRVKLDIRKAMRCQIKQQIETRISEGMKKRACQEEKQRVEWKQAMLEVLNKRFIGGLDLNYIDMEHYVKDMENNPPPSGSTTKGNQGKKKSSKTKQVVEPFSMYLNYHVQVSKTLLLQFSITHPKNKNALVLIDCRNAEGFLKPTILYNEPSELKVFAVDKFMRIPVEMNTIHGHKGEIIGISNARQVRRDFPYADVRFCLFDATSCEFLHHIVTDPGVSYAEGDEHILRTNINLGKKLYGIHPDETRLICNHMTHSTLSPKFYPFIKNLEIIGDRLLVTTEEGVCLVSPDTLDPVDIRISMKRACPLIVDDTGGYAFIKLESAKVKVLAEKTRSCEGAESGTMIRVALAVNTYLVMMELTTPDRVDITSVTELPGTPVEGFIVGETAGLLVTATLHKTTQKSYTENLYNISWQGDILGILPCLGMGPHSFFSFYYSGAKDCSRGPMDTDPPPGWYVYFGDGYGGICCIRLGPSVRGVGGQKHTN